MNKQQFERELGEDRFWCDGFDGDLYRLVPAARLELQSVVGVRLFTYGGTSGGHLNHPACWNQDYGMAAFFGFDRTCGKPAPFSAFSDQVVECTFEEAIRDAWPHNLTVVIERRLVWNGFNERGRMMELLGNARGWKPMTDAELKRMRDEVRFGLADAVLAMRDLLNERGGQ